MAKMQLRKTRGKKVTKKKVTKKKVGKKRGAPPAPDTSQLEEDAKDAVAAYEEERNVLNSMRSDFKEEYPDADTALNDIKHQEDLVSQSVTAAKAKVAIAKIGVGDFICQRSFAQPGYDDKKLTEILKNLEGAGEIVEHLLDAGVIKEFKVDKPASAAFAAANPEVAEDLFDAWKDKSELTPRVTVPKL